MVKITWQACKSISLESEWRRMSSGKLVPHSLRYSQPPTEISNMLVLDPTSPIIPRATFLQISAGECGNRHAKVSELCLLMLSRINHLCLHKAWGKKSIEISVSLFTLDRVHYLCFSRSFFFWLKCHVSLKHYKGGQRKRWSQQLECHENTWMRYVYS